MGWQFFRGLSPIQAISFDLDDTLYANAPVMAHAEQFMVDYLAQHLPHLPRLNVAQWKQKRLALAAQNPELGSDMTALRQACLQQFFIENQTPQADAKVADVMAVFFEVRNQIQLVPEVVQLLAALAQKYPLVAISNGNADIYRMGLGEYFSAAYRPSAGVRGKPYTDMFVQASEHLKLTQPSQLLHVGDHPKSDVVGALNYGAQAVWFDSPYLPADGVPPLVRLPHARIQSLAALFDLC